MDQSLEATIGKLRAAPEYPPTLDPNLAKHPSAGLGLSAADKRALVAFLKTLTG